MFYPIHQLVTVCESSIRNHLVYTDIRYDQTNVISICNKIEPFQNNPVLVAEHNRGSSKEKQFQKLGIGYLNSRQWFRKLCLFYKINVKKCVYFYQ